MLRVVLILLLAVLVGLVAWLERPRSTPPITGDDGRPLPESIAVLEPIRIGGLEQWLLIRGRDRSAPVLLWLHGGPGAAQIPVARAYNGALEEDFIVVHWDQRGAGLSNPRDFDPGTMTFARFIADAREVTAHLKARFDTERIYLLGHSWGTQLGLRLVRDYVEDYHAYIAVGQAVDPDATVRLAHDWLTERLQEAGDAAGLEKLASLGPPPYRDHQAYVTFAGLVTEHGGGIDVPMSELLLKALAAPEYRASDLVAWFRGANRGSGPMWREPAYANFNALSDTPRLDLPVFFLNGRRDYITPLALTRRYHDHVAAPMQDLIVFENSAHAPFFAEPQRFYSVLHEIKSQTWRGPPR